MKKAIAVLLAAAFLALGGCSALGIISSMAPELETHAAPSALPSATESGQASDAAEPGPSDGASLPELSEENVDAAMQAVMNSLPLGLKFVLQQAEAFLGFIIKQ